MMHYRAYGLTIASALPLPELEQVPPPAGAADVEVRQEAIDREWTGGYSDREVEERAEGPVLHYRNGVKVHVRAGRVLAVDPAGEEAGWIRQCLLGPAFALLLQQRGGVVLHGSAVRIGDTATVFVGHKGEGKSTTAATLHRMGHRMLTDDVAALDWRDGALRIRPGFAHMKLAPDAASALGVSPDDLTPYHSNLHKRILRVEDAAVSPAPLERICVLETADEPALEPLSPRFALGALMPHLYAPRFQGAASVTPAMLAEAGRLVKAVPVYRFARPRDLDRLPEALDLLLTLNAEAASTCGSPS